MRIRAGVTSGWQDTEVFVFGLKINNCVAADTREGWADILLCDDAGRALIAGNAVKTERLYGDVALEFPANG